MVKFLILTIVSCGIWLIACGPISQSDKPNTSKAVQAALDEGYTNVTSDGPAVFGCSNDDSVLTSENLTATNSNGKRVKLVSCCGLFFKGCTVRH